MTLKLISWNVNGLRALHRKGIFLPFLKKENPDILLLQEVKAEAHQIPEEAKNIPGYSSHFSSPHTKKGYSGVALYTKIPPKKVWFDLKNSEDFGDFGEGEEERGNENHHEEGRVVAARYENFTLLNAYFPNGGGGPERLKYKLEFYDEFLAAVQTLRERGEKIIFTGDINTAHEAIDLARPKENENNTGFLPEERAWLDEVIASGYVDTFRFLHPNAKDAYSYWDMKTRARERNVGWRIDYFFASRDLLPKIKRAEILPDIFGSDHCPILLELEN